MPFSPQITTLIDAALHRCLAVVYYRKGAAAANIKPRLVEPYSFVGSKQGLMVRCFQREHGGNADEAGWRFFMAHKLQSVEPTTTSFRPRRRITLPATDVVDGFEPDNNQGQDGRGAYRDYVGDALADGRLEPGELLGLEEVKQQFSLKPEDIRFIHASIYHRCLGAIIEDGIISEDEISQMRFLHGAMRSLGWAVGD